jgi:hypothetical protein
VYLISQNSLKPASDPLMPFGGVFRADHVDVNFNRGVDLA